MSMDIWAPRGRCILVLCESSQSIFLHIVEAIRYLEEYHLIIFTAITCNYLSIDFDKSIYYYIPLDGCEPIEIGIEDFFPKPSPWICIEGIAKKFPLKDIEGELERNLEHGETESDDDTAKVGIVDVRREQL